MSDIKFSVIIPCYNVEDKIENCLKSVLNQSMETDSYEVIVVDDGSTDKTKDRIIGDCKLPNGVKPNKLDHYFYSPIRGARQFGEDECLGFQWFLFNNTAVRRYVIEKVGYFDENYTSYGGEDTELAIRIWESFPNGLRYSSKACSEHHHQRSLDDFCRTMEYYGKNNFPRLINTYPKYKKHLGGDWVQSKKGYLIFNPFTGLFVTILNSLFTSYFLVRFQVIYAVVRGARNST
jgi:glycosyltransferase involved in cell wall biosynthesis